MSVHEGGWGEGRQASDWGISPLTTTGYALRMHVSLFHSIKGKGAGAPLRLLTGKFLLTCTGKRQGRKEGKMEQKRRKIKEGKVENWKWKEEKLQNKERTPLFFFFFAFHFWKTLKFVLVLPKWEFSSRKKHFMRRKKSGKYSPPKKNFPVTPLGGGLFVCRLFQI